MAATSIDVDRLELRSSESLTWYEPAEGVSYGFCSRCGSSLFWSASAKPTISIAAGTLDQPTGLRTTSAWWVTEVGDYFVRQPGLDEHPFDGD